MNQVAVKEKSSGIYEFSLVPFDQVILIWDEVKKYLKKSASRSGGRTRVEDILYDILNKQAYLWIIFDTGDFKITGVQITLFNTYPTGKKMLNLEHTSGKNMQEWVEKGILQIIRVDTDEQQEDIFTKPLVLVRHQHLRKKIMGWCCILVHNTDDEIIYKNMRLIISGW